MSKLVIIKCQTSESFSPHAFKSWTYDGKKHHFYAINVNTGKTWFHEGINEPPPTYFMKFSNVYDLNDNILFLNKSTYVPAKITGCNNDDTYQIKLKNNKNLKVENFQSKEIMNFRMPTMVMCNDVNKVKLNNIYQIS